MDEMNTVGTLYIVATPIGNARDMTEQIGRASCRERV